MKLYAKQVQLDEQEVLEAFDKLNKQSKEPAKLQSFSKRVAKQANDDRLMLVTYLVLFVVIALVVIWWWQQSSKSADKAIVPSNVPTAEARQVVEQPAEQPQIADQNQTDDSAPVEEQEDVQPADAFSVEESDVLGQQQDIVNRRRSSG